MATYKVTADATYTSISVEVDALNPDDAWEIAKEKHGGNLLYNGKVEELPTRSELLARIQELETAGRHLVNCLPESEIDLARDAWGHTNANVVLKYKNEFSALLNNTEKE